MGSTTTVVGPTETDAAKLAKYNKEVKEIEMLYEAEIKSFVNQRSQYETNLGKAFAFIFAQCNKVLQNKLYAQTDYNLDIKGNPIEVLNAIEEHSMS